MLKPTIQGSSAFDLSDEAITALAAYRDHGPRFLWDNRKTLSLEEAEIVSDLLRQSGFSVMPYHFPKTGKVWQSTDEKKIPYLQHATKELIVALAEFCQVDYKKPKGFKEILSHLTVNNFRNFYIDDWGTTVAGVLDHFSSSPSAPVLELINNDPDFRLIKKIGIDAGDFPSAPNSFYIQADGTLTEQSLIQALKFIKRLAKRIPIDGGKRRANYRNPKHFKLILKKLSSPRVQSMPINYWGTKLSTVLKHYNGSCSQLFLSLIDSHPDFKKIKAIGIDPFDFPKSPNGTWKNSSGQATDTARDCIEKLILIESESMNLTRPYIAREFELVLPIVLRNWKTTEISYWGTTVRTAVEEAYGNSIRDALKDVVRQKPLFRRNRKNVLAIIAA